MATITEKYGEKPEKFMNGLQRAVYELDSEKIRRQKADEEFRKQKGHEDSRLLSRISSVVVSAWEIGRLIATLKSGQMISVDASGQIYRGQVNTEKMEKLPMKVAQHVPSNMDDAEYTYKKFVSKSLAEPQTVAGFKSQWASLVKKANKENRHGILCFFLEIVYQRLQKSPDDITVDIEMRPYGQKIVQISIKGIATKVITNERGKMIAYINTKGILVEV